MMKRNLISRCLAAATAVLLSFAFAAPALAMPPSCPMASPATALAASSCGMPGPALSGKCSMVPTRQEAAVEPSLPTAIRVLSSTAGIVPAVTVPPAMLRLSLAAVATGGPPSLPPPLGVRLRL